MSSQKKTSFLRFSAAAALAATVCFAGVPFFWLLLASLLPDSAIDRGVDFSAPMHFTLKNYGRAFEGDLAKQFWQYLWNTIRVSLCTGLTVAIFSFLGAFGLLHYRLRMRRHIQQAALWGYLLPPIILIFPYSALLSDLGWNGTLGGLYLANVAFCFPFGLWLMIGYLRALPPALYWTAANDGASWIGTLWHVIWPRALPGFAAVAMFSFILSWNDVVLSLVLSTNDTRTLAAGLKELILDADWSQYSTFAAASTLVALPALVAFGAVEHWVDRRIREESNASK
jgi:multiple sugar transport system permease protein